jgi:nitronate monooxygenase
MIKEVGVADIVESDAFTKVAANWIRQSVERANTDLRPRPETRDAWRGATLPDGTLPWRDIWSAGHSAGLVEDIPAVSTLVDRLAREFESANRPWTWRSRLG